MQWLFPSLSRTLPVSYRSLSAASSCLAARAKSRPHPKSQVHPLSPTVVPPKDGNTNSPDDKVLMLEVKKTVMDLLEKEGPMSRRKIYDDHLSQIYPIAPFVANPPPSSLRLQKQSNFEPERVYLTMSKVKDKVIRDLVDDGIVSVITIRKAQHLIAAIDALDNVEEITYRKQKLERLVASESEKTFVWILNSWIVPLPRKSFQRSQREPKIPGHTQPTPFKSL